VAEFLPIEGIKLVILKVVLLVLTLLPASVVHSNGALELKGALNYLINAILAYARIALELKAEYEYFVGNLLLYLIKSDEPLAATADINDEVIEFADSALFPPELIRSSVICYSKLLLERTKAFAEE